MSYILEALRKAEAERSGKMKKARETSPKPPLPRARTDRLLLLAVLCSSALLLCVSTVIIALLVLRSPESTGTLEIIQPQELGDASPATGDSAGGAYANTPWLADMSQNFRENLPTLTVNAHIHASNNPNASFTILSGQRLQNGESTNTGVTVVFIDKDSLVLRYREELFKLPVEY